MTEENLEGYNHHVAWADRIGLNRQWAKDIEACSNSYGTPGYIVMVHRFRSNIPNMRGDGPKLRDMIDEKELFLFTVEKQKLMDEYLLYHPEDATCESSLLQKEDELNMILAERLYRFILQRLEDEGFGFYESKIEEDIMK